MPPGKWGDLSTHFLDGFPIRSDSGPVSKDHCYVPLA